MDCLLIKLEVDMWLVNFELVKKNIQLHSNIFIHSSSNNRHDKSKQQQQHIYINSTSTYALENAQGNYQQQLKSEPSPAAKWLKYN